MNELLGRLRTFDALRDTPSDERADKVLTRTLPCQPPDLAHTYLDRCPNWMREALAALKIDALYTHQAEAIERIRAGHDVVLEAPTASGKTLCFNIPLIEMLFDDSQAHALMLHPMKALSNDQRRQFEELVAPLNSKARRRLESWLFDGDLDHRSRALIKEQPPAVLFTNPEMLHQSFLGWHHQWVDFLSHMKLMIIDEIHEYRGYFGTNVALLLRRFFAKLSQLGARPQIVLATATCGNAEEHAYRLTGRRCTLVRASTAMRPERHFAFITPGIADYHYHDIYRLRIARAALACVAHGLNTIIFCPSRRFAEEAAIRAQHDAKQYGVDPMTIAPYRSGYDAKLRREIEEGLRTGRYKAVFSTNALEIGVDIGQLDACILAGFPDSVFSAWQRIGRVGRSWDKKAYVLYYAFNNPFDRFYASNIDVFLNKPLDEILIGVDNEELMSRHIPYLMHECGHPLPVDTSDCLGPIFTEFAKKTMIGKKPVRGHKPSYQRLSIRGGSGTVSRLMYKGREIGTISDVHLFREAFVGAIYNHFGKAYRVTAHAAGEVHLEDAKPHYRTEGIFYTVTQGAELLAGIRYGERMAACCGKLTVFENFAGYRLIDTQTDMVVKEERNQLARSSNVRGFWLEVTNLSYLEGLCEPQDLFGFEQILRIGAPFVVSCDRHDLSTVTTIKPSASVYLYETVPGGIGIAEKVLEIWPRVVETGIGIAETCKCEHGCPSCLVPSRLPSGFDEPRKEAAIAIARHILDITTTASREKYDPDTHMWVPI